jgi:hypothetical protein
MSPADHMMGRTVVGDVRDHPKVAYAASHLLQDVFGKDKSPCRLVHGVVSLPLGAPVEWVPRSSWKSSSRWTHRRIYGQG